MRARALLAACCSLCALAPANAQNVLLEAPIALQAPGFNGLLTAYYDADDLYTSPAGLLEVLGYTILELPEGIQATDAKTAFMFNNVDSTVSRNGEVVVPRAVYTDGPNGELLVEMETLQQAFGADIEWDPTVLQLRFSSAAETFDALQFAATPPQLLESSTLPRFGRVRQWFGGMLWGYNLSHQRTSGAGARSYGYISYAADLGGGTLRGRLTRNTRTANWVLDLRRPYLTQVRVAYAPQGQAPTLGEGLTVRVSNQPLANLRVHRTRALSGVTAPHAVVTAFANSEMSERVQADRAGRYSVRVPVMYGSSSAELRVEPLGASTMTVRQLQHHTPLSLLPAGQLYYTGSIGHDARGVLEYGPVHYATLRYGYIHAGRRHSAGATVQLRPTLHVLADLDLTQRSGVARLSWWHPNRQVTALYNVSRRPQLYRSLSSATTIGNQRLAVQSRILYRQYGQEPGSLSIQPAVLAQVWGNMRIQADARWNKGQPLDLGAGIHPSLNIGRGQILLRAEAGWRDRQFAWWVTEGRYSIGVGQLIVGAERSRYTGHLSIRFALQLNTDWVWAASRARRAGGVTQQLHSVRGAIALGRSLALTAIHHEEQTQALIRIFVDTNLNGRFDRDESISQDAVVWAQAHHQHRTESGGWRMDNLEPYGLYVVQIERESIRDPDLHPAVGYRFAFTAEPGRMRTIDVPLQPLPQVTGQITGWTRANEVLEVVMTQGEDVHRLPVYRDGGFWGSMRPGQYRVQVIHRITGEVVLDEGRQVEQPATTLQLAIDGG